MRLHQFVVDCSQFCWDAQVDEFNAARLKMTAEMVDSSNLLKTLVVKAEDIRNAAVGDQVPAWRWHGGAYFQYPALERKA